MHRIWLVISHRRSHINDACFSSTDPCRRLIDVTNTRIRYKSRIVALVVELATKIRSYYCISKSFNGILWLILIDAAITIFDDRMIDCLSIFQKHSSEAFHLCEFIIIFMKVRLGFLTLMQFFESNVGFSIWLKHREMISIISKLFDAVQWKRSGFDSQWTVFITIYNIDEES